MAFDHQVHYTRIGFVLMLGLVACLAALIYLGGVRDVRHEFFVETAFRGGVSGLSVGSDVNYNGVKVGRVDAISFLRKVYPECDVPADRGIIWVRMALDKKLCFMDEGVNSREEMRKSIQDGMHAKISANPVTGLSRIELVIKPELIALDRPLRWKTHHPYIPPARSLFESAGNAAERILGQIDQINLVEGWTNIVTTFSAAQSFLRTTDQMLQNEQDKINEILTNVREASVNLREAVEQIRSNPSTLIRSTSYPRLNETAR